MFWKNKNKSKSENHCNETPNPNAPTAREKINEELLAYNKSIDEYKILYLKRFYNTWARSINTQRTGNIDKFDFTFYIPDDFEYRPIEAWNQFLDNVISLHPDIQFTIKKSNCKDRDGITFNYKNCLDDPWLFYGEN